MQKLLACHELFGSIGNAGEQRRVQLAPPLTGVDHTLVNEAISTVLVPISSVEVHSKPYRLSRLQLDDAIAATIDRKLSTGRSSEGPVDERPNR